MSNPSGPGSWSAKEIPPGPLLYLPDIKKEMAQEAIYLMENIFRNVHNEGKFTGSYSYGTEGTVPHIEKNKLKDTMRLFVDHTIDAQTLPADRFDVKRHATEAGNALAILKSKIVGAEVPKEVRASKALSEDDFRDLMRAIEGKIAEKTGKGAAVAA